MSDNDVKIENTDVGQTLKTIQENKLKKKLVIAIPGDNFSSKFLISWTSLLNSLWEKSMYEILICTGVSSFVSFARMHTLGLDILRGSEQKPLNGMEFDYWITIDSDMVFSIENFQMILDGLEKHDVVSGMYRMADLKNMAAVQKWDTEYFEKNGKFQFLTQEDVDEWRKKEENVDNPFMEIAYCGMGFMGVSSKVLSAMKYPYFDGENTEIKSSKGDGKTIVDLSSEDVCFCKNIQKAGFKIMLHTGLRVGHEKKLVI
jgi:hypothetical protein